MQRYAVVQRLGTTMLAPSSEGEYVRYADLPASSGGSQAAEFVAEVYRRMGLRHAPVVRARTWEEVRRDPLVIEAMTAMRRFLPADKAAPILDIGMGTGWFMLACVEMGYTNVHGADFGIERKRWVKALSPSIAALHDIGTNIEDLLADMGERFDFIHMSHVIEHVPKYALLRTVDSLYHALRRGGTLFMRTPNMEGPCANSCLYVTLTHEYGFTGSSITSLLDCCNFEDVQLHDLQRPPRSVKQRLGDVLRAITIRNSALRHRLFGVNYGGKFGSELVVTGRRGELPAHFCEALR